MHAMTPEPAPTAVRKPNVTARASAMRGAASTDRTAGSGRLPPARRFHS